MGSFNPSLSSECSWARHLTLTVPLFTQVYRWVPANLMLGVTLRWTGVRQMQTADLQTRAWVSQTRTSVGQTSASYRYRYI